MHSGKEWPRETMNAKDYGCTSILVLIVIYSGCFELIKVANQSLRKTTFTLLRIVDLACRCIFKPKSARDKIFGFFGFSNLLKDLENFSNALSLNECGSERRS